MNDLPLCFSSFLFTFPPFLFFSLLVPLFSITCILSIHSYSFAPRSIAFSASPSPTSKEDISTKQQRRRPRTQSGEPESGPEALERRVGEGDDDPPAVASPRGPHMECKWRGNRPEVVQPLSRDAIVICSSKVCPALGGRCGGRDFMGDILCSVVFHVECEGKGGGEAASDFRRVRAGAEGIQGRGKKRCLSFFFHK